MPFQQVKNHLANWFDYPSEKVFCQVATTLDTSPHVRTMDLYHITDEGNLILSTNTHSRKWSDLHTCPNIAICIIHLDHGQIIAEGTATLKTSANDNDTTTFYWNNHLDKYWQDYYIRQSQNTPPNKTPESFGLIQITPIYWEIIEINKDDYLKSPRKQFHLQKDTWAETQVAPK